MKKIIITGASSGIGKAFAQFFHQKNWRVTLVARNLEKLQALSRELPGSEFLSCDLGDKKAVEALIPQLTQTPVHGLINNAAIFVPQAFQEDQDEPWDSQFQTNLMGPVRLTRGLWPALAKEKAAILNISSTLGIRPIANCGAYSALKAALNNWTQSLAIEGAPLGIRANAICPGIVDTPIHSYVNSDKPEDKEIYASVQKAQPLGRTGQPEDLSALAYHLCSDEAAWTTGAIINVDGGILLNS